MDGGDPRTPNNKRRRTGIPAAAPHPDLIPTGLKARDQLLAFATSSHARCGARSSARTFTSLSASATSPLWDWCLNIALVAFGICLDCATNGGKGVRRYNIYLRIAVSAALNSIAWTERPFVCCGGPKVALVGGGGDYKVWCQGAVDIDHVVYGSKVWWMNTRFWFVDLRCGAGAGGRALNRIDGCHSTAQGGAGKWWVRCFERSRREWGLMVQNVLDSAEVTQKCGEFQFPEEHEVQCEGVFVSKGETPVEAVLFFLDTGDGDAHIMVIDVEKTHATRNPVVLSAMKWHQPQTHFHSGVIMRTVSGHRVIFVEVIDEERMGSVFKFGEGGTTSAPYYEPKAISKDTNAVSQLSSSLLGISKTGVFVEIWDCNSSATVPLRVIDGKNTGIQTVIAESGFLFHQRVMLGSSSSNQQGDGELEMEGHKRPTPNKRSRLNPQTQQQHQHLEARLPELIPTALKARDQLLAFAMSSHARCGARSPAHAFTSLSAAATSPLWDWCLTLTLVTFGICVPITTDRGGGGGHNVYTRLGVSAALNSITWIESSAECKRCAGMQPADRVWYKGAVDIDRAIASFQFGWTTRHWLVDLRRNGTGKDLSEALPGFCALMGGNDRWWLSFCFCVETVELFLVVCNLQDSNCSGVACSFMKHRESPKIGSLGMLFSKVDPDEALILFENGNDRTIMVIDVAKTHATKSTVVVTTLKWNMPTGNSIHSGVAMRTAAGKRVIFVEVSGNVFKSEEGCDYKGNDAPIPFSTGVGAVSQLNSSLWCISKSDTVEIWDCNSGSTEPLRVIERILKPGLLNPPVVAESGFLFHQGVKPGQPQDGDDELKVTDSLGNHVVTLKCPNGMWQTPHHDFSVSGFL
ncbi:hypothetical protein Pelo_14896 [Pelomyxa schiedti]|nr:hypothetical protein Pelo_14896 [Pelomyxa schiedti]